VAQGVGPEFKPQYDKKKKEWELSMVAGSPGSLRRLWGRDAFGGRMGEFDAQVGKIQNQLFNILPQKLAGSWV
jgi:hypothetical protein